jgi:hypothetical protein
MTLVTIPCAWCGQPAQKERRDVNRSGKNGMYLYCGRSCSGLGRRANKTKEQKVAEKAAYDAEYRIKNRDALKEKKAEYFQRTYDPESARENRKATMPRHIEYCRRPEYKAYKTRYDRQYRAKHDFGEFWESAVLLVDINHEIQTRITRNEIYAQNGTQNKSLRRKRDFARLVGGQS